MLTRRNFSKSFLASGTIAVAVQKIWPGYKPTNSQNQSIDQLCDLLIKGGTVIDPGQHLHAQLDIAVKDGRILEISPSIPESRARTVASAKGKIVTAGLIDLHVHAATGFSLNAMNADQYCLNRGVTTVVDAGSVGYPVIAGVRKYVFNSSITRIFALVDIGALGIIVGIKGAMRNLDWINPKLTAQAAKENKPAVVGIKIRLGKDISNPNDELECLKRALDAAEASRLPLMAHIDGPYSPLPDILKMLRKGDVFTHCFNNHEHGILDAGGKILPEVWEARKRGIVFDPAQGSSHLSFQVVEKCLEQGFPPDTISTDLTLPVIVQGPVFSLPDTVSKFMALGMSIDEVIELVTTKPARVFDYGLELGTLRPGNEADIAIFELREGQFEFFDGLGQKRVGHQKLVNTAAVRHGQIFANET